MSVDLQLGSVIGIVLRSRVIIIKLEHQNIHCENIPKRTNML